jgi:hypothetical protein
MKSSTDFAECILESAQANLRSTIRRRLPAAGLTPTSAETPIRFPIALPRRDLHIFVLFPGRRFGKNTEHHFPACDGQGPYA